MDVWSALQSLNNAINLQVRKEPLPRDFYLPWMSWTLKGSWLLWKAGNSSYYFMSQEIWPPWTTSVSLTWLDSPECVRTRAVTNAARNASELLGSCCSWGTRCHRGVCPSSTRWQSPSDSSQPSPGSAAGTVAVQVPWHSLKLNCSQTRVERSRWREKGGVFLGNGMTLLAWVSSCNCTHYLALSAAIYRFIPFDLEMSLAFAPAALVARGLLMHTGCPQTACQAAAGGWNNRFLSCAYVLERNEMISVFLLQPQLSSCLVIAEAGLVSLWDPLSCLLKLIQLS